ncbi:MAG TPA: response regulator [Verrucomicrobiae bacterium]|jgi:two-component system LytT family response regulator|nr:response regulator [Verrucomicrobiae bacterium]
MSIRALIVDDEPLARQGIRLLLQNEPDIVVVGECANGAEALETIQREAPALVFLDVQMPRMDGFALLEALPPEKLPIVIFVTAYDQHAIKAFEVSATDYLLKPLKAARFRDALQRARQQLQSRDTDTLSQQLRALLEAAKPKTGYPSQLSVKNGERTSFVRVGEIDYIEAAANYVILHVGQQNHIVRETLTNLESRLSPKIFLRIHRSFIVNMTRVVGMKPALRDEHVVVLKSGKELPMTRGVREIQQRLEFL